MSVFGASVQRTILEIISLLTRNTPGWITTYLECSAFPTARQAMPTSHHTIFTENSSCFNIFPVMWATSLSPTSSIQYWSACLTTTRSGISTAWRCTNRSTSSMQSGYLYLHTTTSHAKISHMRKFLNWMERRWRKWASTCLELNKFHNDATLSYMEDALCGIHTFKDVSYSGKPAVRQRP